MKLVKCVHFLTASRPTDIVERESTETDSDPLSIARAPRAPSPLVRTRPLADVHRHRDAFVARRSDAPRPRPRRRAHPVLLRHRRLPHQGRRARVHRVPLRSGRGGAIGGDRPRHRHRGHRERTTPSAITASSSWTAPVGCSPWPGSAHAEALANADGPDAVASVLERASSPRRTPPRTSEASASPRRAPPRPTPRLPRARHPSHGPVARRRRQSRRGGDRRRPSPTAGCTPPRNSTGRRVRVVSRRPARRGGLLRAPRGWVPPSSPGIEPTTARDRRRTLVVDCANGVGASKALAALAAAMATRCRPPPAKSSQGRARQPQQPRRGGSRPEGKKHPRRGGFETLPPGAKCVSVDGDADRLVYFTPGASGSALLFDGDKIAALVATHLADLLARCGPLNAFDHPPLRVGVVQTAYANGASTAYVAETLGLERRARRRA